MSKKIMIYGAASAMAHGAAKCFAADKASFYLLGRDLVKLEVIKSDLLARGAETVEVGKCEAADFLQDDGKVLKTAIEKIGDIDTALFAYGQLPDQDSCQNNFETAIESLTVNFTSVVVQVTHLANYFEEKKSGSIIVISSVAGDRGRQSNYVYGCAKGGLSIFLQGVRNRLSKSGVQVLDIKPGFVSSPMTSHLKQGPLFASADDVGEGIYKSALAGRNIVYLPWFWRYIMLIIKSVPEFIFKRLSL